MASARKPVIVRKFSRDWCAGYAGADFGQQRAGAGDSGPDRQSGAHGVGAGEVGLLCAGLPCRIGGPGKSGAAGAQAFFAAAADGGVVAAADAGGRRRAGGAGGQRPHAGGRRGIAADPARYALEHAADLCAAAGDSGAGGVEPDWGRGPQAGRARAGAASSAICLAAR